MPHAAPFLRSVVLFTVLTIVMTWPQAARLATSAQEHQDVYFNMWRFGWVAHALATSPTRVFDGNVFYPERRTLTYSDAMPVESLIAAPLLWARVPPVLVHNLMLLGAIVLSGAGMFVLALYLTGSSTAAITAGIVFAFAPYRFEHYMHMELQWSVWFPWAFWALHRTLETGARRYGVLTGVFVALQFMSSIYYGVYLGTLLGLTAVLLMPGVPKARLKAGLVSLAIGGALTIGMVTPYALPYLATKQEVGGRSAEQVVMFSAKPFSYTLATNTNYLYGERSKPYGRPERRLFPGILPMLLALAGLLLRQPSTLSIAYLLGLVAAFEMSLGMYGYSYSFLYWHAPVFDALRAPARLGIFVLFFLAVLAAKGHAAIESAVPRAGRWVLAAVISGVLMLEYWVAPLPLIPFPNTAPPLYAWLATQPRGVVAEFPMPLPAQTPGHDPIYAYFSTFHWLPTVNGYSGYYPPSYIRRLEQVRHMPDDRAFAALRHDGVRYVVIHTSLYDPDRAIEILIALSRTGQFSELGRFKDGAGEAVVYGMR